MYVPFFRLAQADFEPTLFHINTPKYFIPVILPTYTVYEEDRGRALRNVGQIKFRRKGITQNNEFNIKNKAKV